MALDPILLDLADLSPKPQSSKSAVPVRIQNEKKLLLRGDSVVKEGHGVLDTKNREQKYAVKLFGAEKKENDKKAKEGMKTIKVLKPLEKTKREEFDNVENRNPRPVSSDRQEIKPVTNNSKSMRSNKEVTEDSSGNAFSNGDSDSLIKIMEDGKIMEVDKHEVNISVIKTDEIQEAKLDLEINQTALDTRLAISDCGMSFFCFICCKGI